MNPEKTYSFKGEYLEEQKMVVFGLKSEDVSEAITYWRMLETIMLEWITFLVKVKSYT